MKKKWVTIFERYENVHFCKDVGQIPYHASKILNYRAELWRNISSDTVEETSAFTIINIKTGLVLFSVSLFIVIEIIKQAKFIDVLCLFHFRKYTLIYALIFKFFNKNGRVLIKCDSNNKVMPFVNKGPIYKFIMKHLSRKIDLLLVEHNSVMSFFKDLGFKVFYMPNGVSNELYTYSEKMQKIEKSTIAQIIFVGKCGDPRKNCELAIRALAKLPSELKWHAKFYGGMTPDFIEYINDFRKNKPDFVKRLEFMGFVADVNIIVEAYEKSHIFLMTSTSEGYPLSMIEACWMGCMPILSETSGGDDLVLNSAGYIYHNDEDLYQILLKSIVKLDETIHHGKDCQQYVKHNNDWRLNFDKLGGIL